MIKTLLKLKDLRKEILGQRFTWIFGPEGCGKTLLINTLFPQIVCLDLNNDSEHIKISTLFQEAQGLFHINPIPDDLEDWLEYLSETSPECIRHLTNNPLDYCHFIFESTSKPPEEFKGFILDWKNN